MEDIQFKLFFPSFEEEHMVYDGEELKPQPILGSAKDAPRAQHPMLLQPELQGASAIAL